jgi:mono/diheme cytochrome c family protein
MWNTEKSRSQQPAASRQKVANALPLIGRRVCIFLLASGFWLLASGCRSDMQNQPKYLAYRASTTFADGMSSRPYVEGTIPRGYLREDKLFYTGKGGGGAQGGQLPTGGTPQSVMQASAPNMQGGTQQSVGNTNVSSNATNVSNNTGGAQEQDATEFPFPVTAAVLKRGQERYNIYCAMCHGMTGFGDGMIPRRGFRRPPSYHTDQLRQAAVGHFFDVITNGWGAMPDYAAQIPVQDRWAIIAYVRALQLSETVNKNEVPPEKLKQQPAANEHNEGGGEHP